MCRGFLQKFVSLVWFMLFNWPSFDSYLGDVLFLNFFRLFGFNREFVVVLGCFHFLLC